ncbi:MULTISPECIES: hypothetical protein [unclassified Microcoleus]|uniref:hypothetical protein n=1 Tax=unclassified Microcoleus TaxID=2642155 RepID=UPI0025E36D85|nr:MULTISPECIES: hypothetical protein [unclassified Microcoleus]
MQLDNKLKGFCMGGGGFISWLVLIHKSWRTRPYKIVEIGDVMSHKIDIIAVGAGSLLSVKPHRKSQKPAPVSWVGAGLLVGWF